MDKEITFYEELVETTGSEEVARKVIKLFDRTRETIGLTENQLKAYNYLLSDRPIISLRQFSKECGFDNPQNLVAILSALVIKGYLVPKGELNETRQAGGGDLSEAGAGEPEA
jgi:hypothetical protein